MASTSRAAKRVLPLPSMPSTSSRRWSAPGPVVRCEGAECLMTASVGSDDPAVMGLVAGAVHESAPVDIGDPAAGLGNDQSGSGSVPALLALMQEKRRVELTGGHGSQLE